MIDEANVRVLPNVILDSGVDSTIPHLPGDFAVLVYKRLWISVALIKKNLTDDQYAEYLQYLVCGLCGRPCAGTCSA